MSKQESIPHNPRICHLDSDLRPLQTVSKNMSKYFKYTRILACIKVTMSGRKWTLTDKTRHYFEISRPPDNLRQLVTFVVKMMEIVTTVENTTHLRCQHSSNSSSSPLCCHFVTSQLACSVSRRVIVIA